MRRLVLAAALIAGCGVRTPSPVDLAALVKRLGPVEARHDLEVRIVKDPKDVAAHLALAKLCDEQGRPSQAIEALEAVLRLGGPLGTRWHDDDRARFARLLAARGRIRTDRGAPTAIGDLERAKSYGAKIADDELARAKLARAIVQLRHVDAKERAAGLARARALGKAPADRGDLGIWLWSIGAKRAAYEALAAWHDATPAGARPERVQAAYLAARAWWTPVDGAPPAASELVGPDRCRYGGCDPWELVQNGMSSDAIDALLLAPHAKTSDPERAFAWLAITLAQTLRDDGTSGGWGARFASRVDLAALSIDKLPAGGRAAFALLTGRELRDDASSDGSPPARYLAAAVAAFRGAKPDEVRAQLGALAESADGVALLAIAAPPSTEPVATPYVTAVARYVHARVGLEDRRRTAAILKAYAIDPLRGDRFARDAVAEFADGAAGHAWVGALYDALQDPARARASWQAAVDDSPGEPALVRGLAEAIARANDPDAALVIATHAAASAGDPSPVWIAIAEALHGNGSDVHALEAARYAIDLSTADTVARAYEIAIATSIALGRTGQVAALRARREQLSPPVIAERADDPTDAVSARGTTADRMWTASRWNPRDVAIRAALLDELGSVDPRRNTVIAELVALAGDRDVERGRTAIRALRRLD